MIYSVWGFVICYEMVFWEDTTQHLCCYLLFLLLFFQFNLLILIAILAQRRPSSTHLLPGVVARRPNILWFLMQVDRASFAFCQTVQLLFYEINWNLCLKKISLLLYCSLDWMVVERLSHFCILGTKISCRMWWQLVLTVCIGMLIHIGILPVFSPTGIGTEPVLLLWRFCQWMDK